MNFLVTGAWNEAKQHLSSIEDLGHKVVFLQNEKDPIPCDLNWVEGVICNGLFLYHDIDLFESIKYVQLTSAGYDRVPIDKLLERGITVNNAKGVYSIPMAEFALCSVLQFYKRSYKFSKNQKIHKWEKIRTLCELTNKSICIVGSGSVGSECAKRFKSFGCSVTGIDIHIGQTEYFDRICPINELDECLRLADVVILTLPLTENTYHLIDKARLELLKNACVLVNIARGGIIDTNALIECLNYKDLCVALDVFEEEPLCESSILWDMENVIITPHNSFVGEHNAYRLRELIFKNLKDL